MGALTKTDAAIESALIALGMSQEQAEFALRDMLIEEVSYVDRAANRRKFLVVKSAGGSMDQTGKNEDGAPVDASAKDAPITLSTTVKEALLRVLTESLERLVSTVEMVKAAEETSDTSETPMPETLGKEIGTIADLLGGALSQYASAMSKEETTDATAASSLKAIGDALPGAVSADGTIDAAALADLVAQLGALAAPADGADVSAETKADEALATALSQAGEIAAKLAEQAGTEDELSAETVAGVRQLAAMLNEVVEAYPEPQAKADDPPADGAPADATTDAATDGAPPADVTKAGRKMSAGRLKKLKAAVDALAKLISELEADDTKKRLAGEAAQPDPDKGAYGSVGTGGAADDTQAGPAQGEDVDGLADVMKQLTALQKSVTAIANTPDAPASRQEPAPVSKGNKNGTAAPVRRPGGPWVW